MTGTTPNFPLFANFTGWAVPDPMGIRVDPGIGPVATYARDHDAYLVIVCHNPATITLPRQLNIDLRFDPMRESMTASIVYERPDGALQATQALIARWVRIPRPTAWERLTEEDE